MFVCIKVSCTFGTCMLACLSWYVYEFIPFSSLPLPLTLHVPCFDVILSLLTGVSLVLSNGVRLGLCGSVGLDNVWLCVCVCVCACVLVCVYSVCVAWGSHQRCPADAVEVVEEAFGVVDGGTQSCVWLLPLSVQILSTQWAAMTANKVSMQVSNFYCIAPTRTNIVMNQCWPFHA